MGDEYDNLPEPKETTELTDKSDLEDVTIAVVAARKSKSRFVDPVTKEPLSDYYVFDAVRLDTKEHVSFAGGTVLDRQWDEMNEPFKAVLVQPKGKRYWTFGKPGAK
jgi:hypothetical protein